MQHHGQCLTHTPAPHCYLANHCDDAREIFFFPTTRTTLLLALSQGKPVCWEDKVLEAALNQ